MLLVFVLIIIFFTIPALTAPSETVENSIVTVVGIDFDDEYEVSFLAFIPTPGKTFVEQYSVISTKGKSVGEAVEKAGLQIGKTMRLAHTKIALLGNGIIDRDVSEELSYLVHEVSLSKSCMLLSTNSTAKEVMKFVQENDKDSGDKLQNLSRYNTSSIYWGESSIESYFSGYFSPIKSSFLGYMELSDVVEDQGILINSEESQSDESQSDKSGEKELINNGNLCLFKDGKKVGLIYEDEVKGLNWINPNIKEEAFSVKTDNGDIETYFVKSRNVKRSVKICEGIAYLNINLTIKIERVEIKGKIDQNADSVRLSQITEEKKKNIEKYIKKDFSKGLQVLKDKKVDIINVYRLFYQRKRTDFKKFLSSLENKEDFMNFVIFELKVNVEAD